MDILDMDTPIFNDVKDDTPIYDQMVAEYAERERETIYDDTAEIMIVPAGVEVVKTTVQIERIDDEFFVEGQTDFWYPTINDFSVASVDEVFDTTQLLIDNLDTIVRHAKPKPSGWRRFLWNG